MKTFSHGSQFDKWKNAHQSVSRPLHQAVKTQNFPQYFI